MRYEFGIEQTYQWIAACHGGKAANILDIGAGQGRLASRLRAEGFKVTAIDRSENAVAKVNDAGVNVLHADALNFTSYERFELATLVMCAHHLHPLDKALAQVVRNLAPLGQLAIEDFALEDVDFQTAKWFYELRSELCGDENPGDPIRQWQEEHIHEPKLNSGEQIIAAVRVHFEILAIERTPYFYKYLAAKALDTKWRGDLAKKLFAQESELIAIGSIRPIGLRLHARLF